MFEEFEGPRRDAEGWYVPPDSVPDDPDAFEIPTDLAPRTTPQQAAAAPGAGPEEERESEYEPGEDDTAWVSPVVLALEASQAALQWAEARRVLALLDGFASMLEGEEPLGCEGVPMEARRHAYAMQAGLCLHRSPRSVSRLLDAAWTARAGLPAVWELFTEGRCSWQLTDLASRQSQGLEGELLTTFDRAAVRILAESGITPPDAERRLHILREGLQAATAAERRKKAERGRTTTIEPRPDGQAAITLIGPAVEIAAVDDALTQQAIAAHGVEGEQRSIGALKLDIALDLLLSGSQAEHGPGREPVVLDGVDVVRRRVPARKPVTPTVLVTIPAATAAGCSEQPGYLSGYGPIDAETARRWAGTAGYWTRVFLDPATGGLRDIDREARYIPPAVRRWLGARDDICRAPGCRRSANHTDLDHAVRFEYRGPTDPVNLANLCRPHHLDKDGGMWTVRLHPDGAMTWRSVWGRAYTTRPAVRVEPADPPGAGDPGSDTVQLDDVPF